MQTSQQDACISAKEKYDARRLNRQSVKPVQEQQRVSFVCQRCSYPFKVKVDASLNLRCPYCGKEDQLTRV